MQFDVITDIEQPPPFGMSSHQITLPASCRPSTLAPLLSPLCGEKPDFHTLHIEVPEKTHIQPPGLAMLAEFLLHWTDQGRRVEFGGDPSCLRYLERMNLMRLLGVKSKESFSRHPDAGRLIALTKVGDTKDLIGVLDSLGDMVLRQFDDGANFVRCLEWPTTEVMDNAYIHSFSPVPALACAQYFPKQGKLEFAICDFGNGIRHGLKKEYPGLVSDKEAIELALKPGVTRDKTIHKGFGLPGTLEIARANEGSFSVWSGTSRYHLTSTGKVQWKELAPMPGTGIWLVLDVHKPVDLSQICVGDVRLGDAGDSRILDRLEESACTDGIVLAQECHEFSGDTAQALRRKVEAVFANQPSDPVIVSFEGLPELPDEFLETFIGGLFRSAGADTCRSRLRFSSVPDAIVVQCEAIIEKHSAASFGQYRLKTERRRQQSQTPSPSNMIKAAPSSSALPLDQMPEVEW